MGSPPGVHLRRPGTPARDPEREDDEVIGPVISFANRHRHNPYTPTDQIVFDWQRRFLRFDAPGAVGFVGLLARSGDRIEFKPGVTLSDVTIRNPPGIYDPVREDERYVAFTLHSNDGAPLAATKSASLSLVSTSFNTGFALSQGRNVQSTVPVLVARVGGTIRSPALAGMSYTLRDWHLAPIGQGRVGSDGTLVIEAGKPIFVVDLRRK